MLGHCTIVRPPRTYYLKTRTLTELPITVVEASRSTLFDLHSRIGLNLGVLAAWCVVNVMLFPLCCYFMRWKTMRSKSWKEKESEQKKF